MPTVLTYALVGSTLVVVLATIHSESSWLTGVMLIFAYLIVAIVFFMAPEGELHEGLDPESYDGDTLPGSNHSTEVPTDTGRGGSGSPTLSKVGYHLVANSRWLNPHEHGFNLDSIHWARLFAWE